LRRRIPPQCLITSKTSKPVNARVGCFLNF
jgi:hypothetical protein